MASTSRNKRVAIACTAMVALIAAALAFLNPHGNEPSADALNSTGGTAHAYSSTCIVEAVGEFEPTLSLTFESGKPDWIDQKTVSVEVPQPIYDEVAGAVDQGDRVVVHYLRPAPGERIELDLVQLA